MRKAHLLLALSTLLIIGCRHIDRDDHRCPPDLTSILDVIVNGPYTLVWTPSRPDVITLISPRDADGLHRFYFNNLTDGTDQNVHIALGTDGLKAGAKLIDPYFPPDFIADTAVWKRPTERDPQKDYLVTIELPLPEKVTFVSPLHPVTFANGTQSFQATNFVLEYKVTDFGKIHATSDGSSSVSPLSSSALLEQYAALCGKADVRQKYYESCSDIRNLLEQCARAKTKVFFLGVGIPLKKQIKMSHEEGEAHAVNFFNLMLQSFSDLEGKRLIVPENQYNPKVFDRSTALMKASFRVTPSHPQLHPVPVNAFTAVIDCKAGNLIVTAKTTQ